MSSSLTPIQKAKRQIEFYFNDSNFARDKHLQAKALEDDEGFIELAHINTFARMKTLGLSVEQLAEALKDSEIVQLNSDNTKIKRKNPLPEVDTTDLRTLYLKGFPKEYNLDEVQDYIENPKVHKKQYKTSLIRLRRYITGDEGTGAFKGTALVTFPTIEESEAFWSEYGSLTEEIELGEQLKGDCSPEDLRKKLMVLKASDWMKMRRKSREKPSAPSSKKSPEDSKTKKGKNNNEIQQGTLVKFEVDEKESKDQLTRECIKASLPDKDEVAFIYYEKGDKNGHLRFKTPESASKVAEKKSIKTENGHVLNLTLLDSEETRKYWALMKRRK